MLSSSAVRTVLTSWWTTPGKLRLARARAMLAQTWQESDRTRMVGAQIQTGANGLEVVVDMEETILLGLIRTARQFTWRPPGGVRVETLAHVPDGDRTTARGGDAVTLLWTITLGWGSIDITL